LAEKDREKKSRIIKNNNNGVPSLNAQNNYTQQETGSWQYRISRYFGRY
jgi:FtsZ-binding cell division protein ZapB